jgi:signal transduction histidine kinase
MDTCVTETPAHCEAPRETEDDLTLVHATKKGSIPAFDKSDSKRSPHTRRDQVKLLEVQPAPKGESPDSITLTKSFIEACKSDNSSKPKISDLGNILMFDKDVDLDLRNEPQRREQTKLIEAERMSEIGRMACSISHDMRHSLSAIYANAEFLERHDLCARARADLLLEIQEAVLAMTESIDSLLQFGSSGRKNPVVHERVSLVVEKAVAAVKFHPDGRNVSITVEKLPPAKADIDARNLESAVYNLLLNACQAAICSTRIPEVKVNITEFDERIYVTILDNGPGIPASVRRTLFDPFVTAGKPNGTGLGLTLARRIAEEHGGSVCLEESNRERTAFTLSLTKNRSLL